MVVIRPSNNILNVMNVLSIASAIGVFTRPLNRAPQMGVFMLHLYKIFGVF